MILWLGQTGGHSHCYIFWFLREGWMKISESTNFVFLGNTDIGWELIFFTAACMVRTKTALITHQCFSYCWAVLTEHQGLFSSYHAVSKLVVHKNLWGGTAGTADLKWRKDVPHHLTLWSAVKAKERRGPTFRARRFIFPCNHHRMRPPCAGNCLISISEWKVVNEFCNLLCLCIFIFALSIKLP